MFPKSRAGVGGEEVTTPTHIDPGTRETTTTGRHMLAPQNASMADSRASAVTGEALVHYTASLK